MSPGCGALGGTVNDLLELPREDISLNMVFNVDGSAHRRAGLHAAPDGHLPRLQGPGSDTVGPKLGDAKIKTKKVSSPARR